MSQEDLVYLKIGDTPSPRSDVVSSVTQRFGEEGLILARDADAPRRARKGEGITSRVGMAEYPSPNATTKRSDRQASTSGETTSPTGRKGRRIRRWNQ